MRAFGIQFPRSVSRLATMGVLLSIMAFSLQGRSERVEIQPRTYFATLMPKNQAREFLNRLATPTGQVVVTRNALNSSSIQLVVPAAQDLYVVELARTSGVLPGELARLDKMAFVGVARGEPVHAQLGRHDLYAERVADSVTRMRPSSLSNSAAAILARPPDEPTGDQGASLIDIDQAYLEQKLKEFSGAVPTQVNGQTVTIAERSSQAGRTTARAWLKEQYEGLGFTTSLHNYSGSVPNFAGGANFIAERSGADSGHYLIVSAHLDSVGNAGADDDGAGTIGALAIAQALKDAPLAIGLRIVGFDEEELGLVGSEAYAEHLEETGDMDRLVGVVNLEMFGYDADNDGAFHVIDCDENTSAQLSAQIRTVVARDPLQLTITPACTNRSDHAVFWRYDKPAIVVSQNFFGGDSNPCYHRSCDRVDRVNFSYMQRLTTASGRAVAALVTAP